MKWQLPTKLRESGRNLVKVLHILDHSIPLHSGYTFRTRSILKQQRANGWETAHITSGKQGDVATLKEEVDEFTFYRTPVGSKWYSSLPLLNQLAIINEMADRLSEVIEETRPDILHAHSPALTGAAALKVKKKFNLPLVYECRGFWEDAAVDHGTCKENDLRYKLTRALETHVFKKADAVTTICEGLRADIQARGLPKGKITIIPNAVDIDRFPVIEHKNEQLLNELGLQGKRVLGFIGSFYAYEGLLFLVDAFAEVVKKDPQARLLLVGGGPEDEAIKARVKELALDEVVILTGRVPHAQVSDYYSLVDLFVYPREKMRLTDLVTPLKPLEAMAQGKLVVASDVGGHKELITDGYNGLLYQSGSQASLIAVLEKMLEESDQWATYRANGRKYVETVRNWEASVANYKDVYERLLR